MTAPQSFPSGHRLGPYELIDVIGRGGFGEVYRARDVRLQRDVAVKCLLESLVADEAQRFEIEARATAALNHPNIISVHDVGIEQGRPYIVTELLSGESLRAMLRRGRPTLAQAVAFSTQIASALAAAHEKDIVHRDLKPENIFVLPDGRIKVLDFGIAKMIGPQAEEAETQFALTRAGAIVGTAAYLSPEQALAATVDQRSDIFSFGAVFYEMLEGTSPFLGATRADTLSAVLRGATPAWSGADSAPSIDRIVRRCLEKHPAQRFQTAADLKFALEAVSPEGATPSQPRGRRVGAVMVAALALFALFVSGAASGLFFDYFARPGVTPSIEKQTVAIAHPLDRVSIANVFPNAGVSTRPVDPTHIEVEAPAAVMPGVLSVIHMADALKTRRFVDEPATVTADDTRSRTFPFADLSDLRVSLAVTNASTKGLLHVIAASAGWPVVLDSSVNRAITLDLQDVPWNSIVRSCLEFQGANLTSLQFGNVWLLTSRDRANQIMDRTITIWMVSAEKLNYVALAKALEAARSERGLILPNARLQKVLIVDRGRDLLNYSRILATIDGKGSEANRPPLPFRAALYSGSKVTWDMSDISLNAFAQRVGTFSGLRVVIDPKPKADTGGPSDGPFTVSVTDTAWDNPVDVVIAASDNGYAVNGNIFRISPLAGPDFTEMTVEAVSLQHDDPAFFLPLTKYLTSAGQLQAEPQTKTLMIRDQSFNVGRIRNWVRGIDGAKP